MESRFPFHSRNAIRIKKPETPRFPRDTIFEAQGIIERSIGTKCSSKYLRRRMATFKTYAAMSLVDSRHHVVKIINFFVHLTGE
jgi:hypothetical protein